MDECPLADIIGRDGAAPEVERTPTGWHIPAAAGLSAGLRGYDDGIACRLEAGEDREVVQLGIGPAGGGLCNAVFSPGRDTALVFRADGLCIDAAAAGEGAAGLRVTCDGPLTVTVVRDYMRVHRGVPWFTPLDRSRFPTAPAGWSSWYYYYAGINEEEVVRNTEWLAANLKPFGCEWVQIDDGWACDGKSGFDGRDWFVTSEGDFPHGMKWCADFIRAHGMRPGIWCMPFSQSDERLYEEHPRLFVHDADGKRITGHVERHGRPPKERKPSWPGGYLLDSTCPEASAYLHRLFHMLCEEWGYEYVKIDGQGWGPPVWRVHRMRLCDPSADADHVYRRGVGAMKDVVGAGRFLLNCGRQKQSCGLCQGMRTAGDVDARKGWDGMRPAVRGTMRRLFLNTIAFYTDPDCVCVRAPLSRDEARVWTTLVGITGQLLMASDKMYELPDERVELLRRIYPVADIHPMELYPLDEREPPGIFDLKVRLPFDSWDVVAVFNWGEDGAKTFELDPERFGLDTGDWLCLDAVSGEFLHGGDGRLAVEVPPHGCRLVSYWRAPGRPRFVGSNRHITQGAVDVQDLRWSDEEMRLSGTSSVVGGEPYVVRVHVPEGYLPLGNDVRRWPPIAEIELRRPENGPVDWRMDFVAC